jgi:beta-glucanase (GH16 family)
MISNNSAMRFFFLAIVNMLFVNNVVGQVLFDDFTSKKLDTTIWQAANTKWGEDKKVATHGGVVPENVFLHKGNLVIRAHGENYKGKIKGHGQDTRVGGVIYTKEKFASGSFEIRAKICPHPGALSAFWTFYYENDDYNHEIDFEFPGRNQGPLYQSSDSNMEWGLMSNWRGVSDSLRRTVDTYFGNQVDGNYHLYRFEWHTGNETEKPRVEWYFDNKLMHTSYEMIPNHASQFWLGIWFPGWIQKANFNKEYMYIDWVKITPFNQKNDVL